VQCLQAILKLKKKPGYRAYSRKFLEHMKRMNKSPTVYQSCGHPKFKSKKCVNDYGFYQDVCKIRFTSDHVHLVLTAGRGKAGSKRNRKFCSVKLAEKDRVPANTKYLNPRVTYDGLHWWVSVAVEIEADTDSQNTSGNGMGIDLGIKDLAVCSDGTVYKNINKTREARRLKKKKRRLQRSISRKYENNKKGESYCKTNNIIKSEKELLRVEHRLADIRQNHIHHVTSGIIKRKPSFICIEDLNVSGMMKNRYLAKAVREQEFHMFRQIIAYKSQWNSIKLIVADRFYPSSKKCSCCGNVKRFLKLSERTYRCDACGLVIDRDYNASINLETYGEHCMAFC
jgi:putative transposase